MTDFVIPDVPEPIVGWRSMGMGHLPTRPKADLVGATGRIWDPPFRMEAQCGYLNSNTTHLLVKYFDHRVASCGLKTGSTSKLIPELTCICGIHAHKTFQQARVDASLICHDQDVSSYYTKAVVKTLMWGRVFEHSRGYRSQHAKITDIWIPAAFYDIFHTQYPDLIVHRLSAWGKKVED